MKVKVPLVIETINKEKIIRPDVDISFTVVEYDLNNNCVIIEISEQDYEKIKDKVIEIIK